MTRLHQLLLLRAPVEAIASWRELHDALHEANRYKHDQHREVVFVLSLYADALSDRRSGASRERHWRRFINALNNLGIETALVHTLLTENADLIATPVTLAA